MQNVDVKTDPFSSIWGEMRGRRSDAFILGADCRVQDPERYFCEIHAHLLMCAAHRENLRRERGIPCVPALWHFGLPDATLASGYSTVPLYQPLPPLIFIGVSTKQGAFLPLRSRYLYSHKALNLHVLGEEVVRPIKGSLSLYAVRHRFHVDPADILEESSRADQKAQNYLFNLLGDPKKYLPKNLEEAQDHAMRLLAIWKRHRLTVL